MAVADVAANLAVVRERIARAGGDVGRITVVAVTKGFGPEAVRDALAAGLVDVGENYAQQLRAKATAIAEARPWGRVGEDEADVRWHLLGRVQRNKVRSVAPLVHLWHGVDRLGLGELSMGMSDDLEVAVQEGSTMVRIGRALFGPRPDPARVQGLQ